MVQYDFPNPEEYKDEREKLIKKLRKRRALQSHRVEEAMRNVPRHLFLPETKANVAYKDSPQTIEEGQTISAPHMNAMMCDLLEIQPGEKILEIGTGSGYHGALMAYLTTEKGHVYTIERHPLLARKAKNIYEQYKMTNITVIEGDGTLGYPKESPFDKILVTAAAPKIPEALIEQLSANQGKMCIPVESRRLSQELLLITKNHSTIQKKKVCGVRFVPLIGEHGFKK